MIRYARLWPEPADGLLAHELLASVRSATPKLVVSMAATADGRAAIDGGSALIGSDADTEHVSALREQVDAIFVAPGTMRAEEYRRPVRSDERIERRMAAGLAPAPLVAVPTRSGDVPWDAPIFADAEARVLVFGPAQPPAGLAAHVEVADREPDPARALRTLRERFGCALVLGEGGPSMNRALFGAGLVDELFLTIAPTIAGGAEAPTIVQGPPLAPRVRLELRWLLSACGDLFLRYAVA